MTYIYQKQSMSGDDFFTKANKKMAGLCARLIAIDTDGLPFLIILDKASKKISPKIVFLILLKRHMIS